MSKPDTMNVDDAFAEHSCYLCLVDVTEHELRSGFSIDNMSPEIVTKQHTGIVCHRCAAELMYHVAYKRQDAFRSRERALEAAKKADE